MRRVRQRQLRRAAIAVDRRKRKYKVGRLHHGQIGPFGLAPSLQVGNWLRGWNRRKAPR